jgi:predicted XRE-type DNA-binding protein
VGETNEKKSKKGIAPSKRNVDLIKLPYKEAKELGNMKNASDTGIEFEEGSGNVEADLGLVDADVRLSRAKLSCHVVKLLWDRKLKQREIAALLGITQPVVSHLMNGHFDRFNTQKLLDFLNRLDPKVTSPISPHEPGEPCQEVGSGL